MDIPNISPIEVEEICREYRRAENPIRQIQISSELHLLTKDQIKAILTSQGYILSDRKLRGNTLYITHNGKTLSLYEWEQETGIPYNTIRRRYKSGWSIPDILSSNPNQRSN